MNNLIKRIGFGFRKFAHYRIRVLNKHGVRYLVVGGITAEIHELPSLATVDVDVTPARSARRRGHSRLAGTGRARTREEASPDSCS